jgi:hypothetical protein
VRIFRILFITSASKVGFGRNWGSSADFTRYYSNIILLLLFTLQLQDIRKIQEQ